MRQATTFGGWIRIAREKLRLIAGQLDPGQFEPLFSRVMSLVPPEELADVLGASTEWPVGGEAESRLASIVRAGYDRWSDFSRRYAGAAAGITALDPGSADWPDLRDFLRRACGGIDGNAGSRPVFSVEGDSVVARDAEVQTVRVFEDLFVCDETDALPTTDQEGGALPRLGTGDRRVVSEIRNRLSERAEKPDRLDQATAS